MKGNSKLAESIMYFQQGVLAREAPSFAGKLFNLGGVQQAEKDLRRSLEIGQEALKKDHPFNGMIFFELARTLERRNALAEAEDCYRKGLAIASHYGLSHPKTQILVGSFCELLRERGKRAEAEKLLEDTVKDAGTRFGPDHPLLAAALVTQARLLDQPKDAARKEQTLREALSLYRRVATHPTSKQVICLMNLAACVGDSRPAEAEAYTVEALELSRKLWVPDHYMVPRVLCERARYRMNGGSYEDVESWLREAQASTGKLGQPVSNSRRVWAGWERLYRETGRPVEAVAAALKWRGLAENDSRELYDVAVALSRNAALVDKAAPDRSRYESLAVATLRQARSRGFNDLAALRNEKALDVLRNRSDFQALMREMEKSPPVVQTSAS
jgi:tetratricopeptide (TPR) repeat protein